MSDAVRRYGRVFQTGSQQRSDGRFRFACELVRNGRIGKLHTIRTWLPRGSACPPKPPKPVPEGFDYDMWLGPAPFAPYCDNRTHWDFRWILDYSGGQVTDWGAHHNDIAQWGHGTEYTGPVEVEGKGEFPKEGLWNAAMTYEFTCTYADGVKLICSDDSKGENGLRFEGTDGWVYVNRGRIDANPKSLLQSKIGAGEIHLYESPGHYRDFVDCIRTRRQPIAPIEQAHRSIAISHLGNIAMLLGRKIKWDPDREVVVGDTEAQRMTSRAMRAPWHL
jgi:predicted dehydrogenase